MNKISQEEMVALGLDPKTVASHQQRIQRHLTNQGSTALTVDDACRIDNGGIIAFDRLTAIAKRADGPKSLAKIVAFIPAAGAASRYFKPLVPLVTALQAEDHEGIKQALQELADQGATDWALPPKIKDALKQNDPAEFAHRHRTELLTDIDQPKAHQPAVVSGESFLYFKNIEHHALQGLEAQVFVVPASEAKNFEEQFEQLGGPKKLPTYFLEQGPNLSTIRFNPDGTPFRDEQGQLSPVPAGHGTLTKLIPDIHRLQPDADTLFIRNIDNVMGTRPAALRASETFLRAHSWLLSKVKQIRLALRDKMVAEASRAAEDIIEAFPGPTPAGVDEFITAQPEDQRALWRVLIHVFHTSPSLIAEKQGTISDALKLLRIFFQRPVNALGQVPNSGHDVGGTPVFTRAYGHSFTMCLELPHASPEDRETFLANPEKATHFNPVFVATEIVDDHQVYDIEDSPFWILAKKTIGPHNVVYHETVLYELLGNSMLANVVFPEIPREVFNPHKSLDDSRGRHKNDWLGDG
jgi:hypothetical protein